MRKTFLQVAIILLITMSALLALKVIFGGTENSILSSIEKKMSATLQIIADWVDNGYIPARYTCDANDEVPTLTIHNIPADTKNLALIVDDPDAPGGTRDHYLLADIPVSGEHAKITMGTQLEAVIGKNSWGRNDRGGPCPPNGVHRYFFKIFALRAPTKLQTGFSKEELLTAIKSTTIATSELIGLYQKQ